MSHIIMKQTLSGYAIANHHTDRTATEGRNKRGRGDVTGRTRRQIVIYKHETPRRKGKKQRAERIKNEIDYERKEGA
jgi:hypothetical protein